VRPPAIRSPSRWGAAGRSNDHIAVAWAGRSLRDLALTSEGYQERCLGRVLPDVRVPADLCARSYPANAEAVTLRAEPAGMMALAKGVWWLACSVGWLALIAGSLFGVADRGVLGSALHAQAQQVRIEALGDDRATALPVPPPDQTQPPELAALIPCSAFGEGYSGTPAPRSGPGFADVICDTARKPKIYLVVWQRESPEAARQQLVLLEHAFAGRPDCPSSPVDSGAAGIRMHRCTVTSNTDIQATVFATKGCYAVQVAFTYHPSWDGLPETAPRRLVSLVNLILSRLPD